MDKLHAPQVAQKPAFTEQQIQLIRNTVAKGASHDELRLFLYRCRNMGLDPLKPGQVHFVKYGNSPGTIIVGIDGFRTIAGKTGMHSGTKRGVLKDAKGNLLGAWAEVYRKDWEHPAREEVPFVEYSTGKGMWQKMPETMIKKVAEVSALRMAFPQQLSGVYSHEEMDQAQTHAQKPTAAPRAAQKPKVVVEPKKPAKPAETLLDSISNEPQEEDVPF